MIDDAAATTVPARTESMNVPVCYSLFNIMSQN